MAAAQGRGSVAVVVGLVLLLCVLLQADVAESAVFNVGDRGGWSFNTNSWPAGKRFKAGDVLGKYYAVHAFMTHFFTCKLININ
jgi:hypothetical protein